MVRITVEGESDATASDIGLYFDGIFDVHKHMPMEGMKDPRVVHQIDLNTMKVYFSQREPTWRWGYPSQLDPLYEDEVIVFHPHTVAALFLLYFILV